MPLAQVCALGNHSMAATRHDLSIPFARRVGDVRLYQWRGQENQGFGSHRVALSVFRSKAETIELVHQR